MKKALPIIGILLLFNSCGVRITSIPYKQRANHNFELDVIQKKEIGESIVIKGEEQYQEAYLIVSTPQFSSRLLDFPYKAGDVLPLSGETSDWLLYYIEPISLPSMTYTAGIAKNKRNLNEVVPFFNSTNGFVIKPIDEFHIKETIYINPECYGCFKKEFIFNGRAGNTLNFTYREYINNLARPAYTQNLQYDLSESNIVGFRGLRIEVLNATNTNIEYKVLSDFLN